jgi:endonuclease/exonuclease/phosphatase (EEP) superfamily protein YafD
MSQLARFTIATWNCCGAAPSKWSTIADLVILQECNSGIVDTARDNGWSGAWSGWNPKGLAVLASPSWSMQPFAHPDPWWLPVRVSGPVEFWAMAPHLTQKTYTRQATITAEAMKDLTGPLVLGGDFNSWTLRPHLAVLGTAPSAGTRQCLSRASRGARNSELDPALYFQWNEDRGYHIDLL